ncbi:VanW family protein [Sphaerimonospora sp. CA-214678]|uniref:VanW family protein n=1 Tax=Sphaerimonospora sp. CA-214678 TaxID=3240029 RepID=UPI003D92CA83
MRNAGASMDPPPDPFAAVPPSAVPPQPGSASPASGGDSPPHTADEPIPSASTGKSTTSSPSSTGRKHPVRAGTASLPRGVSADIFGEHNPRPATPVRADRQSSLPPPPPPVVEPWPVADRTVREEPPPPVLDPLPEPKSALFRYILVGVLGVLLLAYLVPAFAMSGRILPGTTVLGVDIGGLTRAEAAGDLRERLYAQTRAPIIIRQGTRRLTVNPQDAGLSLDVDATLALAATGFPSPTGVWNALTSGREIRPVISVDRDTLAAAVSGEIASAVEVSGREGDVVFRGVTPVPVYPRVGYRLDREAVARQIEKAYLTPEVTVSLVTQVDRPKITRAEVRRTLDWARQAVAAPITLTDGVTSVELPPDAIAGHLTFTPDGDDLRPRFDARRAVAGLERRTTGRWFVDRREAARDASFAIVGGRPRLVHARPGKRVDTERLAGDVIEALGGGSRTIRVVVTSGPPRLSDEDVLKAGVEEEIARYTVPNACCAPNTGNIAAAARLVNHHLVMPGETFSLNRVLGRRDAGSGFGGVIGTTVIRGETGTDVPGISAFATAMLNAVVRAGLEIVDHTPPDAHEPGAPTGLEAAVSYPVPDLKWRNDSPHAVLVQAYTTERALRIALWSTKRYEVEIQGPVTGAVTHLSAVTGTVGACVPSPGRDGFTAQVTRVLRQDGTVVRRQEFRTVYEPRAEVICPSTR